MQELSAELETMNDEANQNLSKERDRSAELDRKLQELTKSLEESKQLSEQNVTRAVAESVAKAEDEGKTLRETIDLLEDKNTRLENDTLVAQTQVRELEGLVDEFKKKVADLEAELSTSKQERNVWPSSLSQTPPSLMSTIFSLQILRLLAKLDKCGLRALKRELPIVAGLGMQSIGE